MVPELGLSLHLFPEGRRRHARFLLEQARKIGLIFDTDCGGHVDDGQRARGQQMFGTLDANDVDPGPDASAGALLDEAAQIILTDAGGLRVSGNGAGHPIGRENGLQEGTDSGRNGFRQVGPDPRKEQVKSFLHKDAVALSEREGEHVEEFVHEGAFVKPEALVDG